MTNVNNLIYNINFETALLEACEWDQDYCNDVLTKLTEYFNVCSKNDIDLVRVDLGHIFNETIANVITEYLNKEIKKDRK